MGQNKWFSHKKLNMIFDQTFMLVLVIVLPKAYKVFLRNLP